jgi:hypothetical protein
VPHPRPLYVEKELCGPFRRPLRSFRGPACRELARTAFHEPHCFRGFSRMFAVVPSFEFHRGVRFELAFLCRFTPSAVLLRSRFRGVCNRAPRTVRERSRRQSTMVLACSSCHRQRQIGRWTTAHDANQMGSSGSSALRFRRLCDGAALPRYVVVLWLSVDIDLRVLPGNADRATPHPRRTHRHFNPRDSAHRDQPLNDK